MPALHSRYTGLIKQGNQQNRFHEQMKVESLNDWLIATRASISNQQNHQHTANNVTA